MRHIEEFLITKIPLYASFPLGGGCEPSFNDAQGTLAPADAERAAAHHLEQLGMRRQLAHETVDFGLAAQQLDDEALARGVEHAAAGAGDVTTHRVAARRIDAQFQ